MIIIKQQHAVDIKEQSKGNHKSSIFCEILYGERFQRLYAESNRVNNHRFQDCVLHQYTFFYIVVGIVRQCLLLYPYCRQF